MTLGILDLVNGILILVLDGISIYVGIRLILKYFKFKQRELLLVGICWIFIVCPWYPAGISFVMYIFTNQNLTEIPYFTIGNVFIPVALLLWIIVLTEFLEIERKKLLIYLFVVYGVFFEIMFFVLLSIDPSLIGYLKGITDVQYNLFVIGYSLSALVTMLITGILFTRQSLKSSDEIIRLKGKLLLTAFLLFIVGAGLDTSVPLNLVTLSIYRTLEVLSAIFFYGGFYLPSWMKKIFLKNQ
ncbi:MAG: hypothetical protein EU533_00460 [Promethearchaeota archaeon]|nr:MAG: hypothetical protein EU533_00460 [Candidatus Lokiarchaeota archaeon]